MSATPAVLSLPVVLALGGLASNATAQPPTTEEGDTFKGLPGVSVFVEPLYDSAERAGLTKAIIQSDVERSARSSAPSSATRGSGHPPGGQV